MFHVNEICGDLVEIIQLQRSFSTLVSISLLLEVCPIKRDCQRDVPNASNTIHMPFNKSVKQEELYPKPNNMLLLDWLTKEYFDFVKWSRRIFRLPSNL